MNVIFTLAIFRNFEGVRSINRRERFDNKLYRVLSYIFRMFRNRGISTFEGNCLFRNS